MSPLFPAASRLARSGGDAAFLSVGARAAGGKGVKQSKGQISAPFSPCAVFLIKALFRVLAGGHAASLATASRKIHILGILAAFYRFERRALAF